MNIMRPIVRNTSLALAVAVIACLGAQHAAAGSQYVVLSVEPAADELLPGKLFLPSDVINVPAGTVVTLLGEDGSMNSISGPGAFVVTADALAPKGTANPTGAQDGPSKLALIAGLLTKERQRTESIGGSRTNADQSKPNRLDYPWAILVDESSPGCIRNGELVLARRGLGERLVFSVRLGNAEPLNGLVWGAGEPTYALPGPVSPDVKTITVETNRTSVLIEVKALPSEADLSDPLEVLGWMVSSGCERQALAFVDTIASKRH